MNGYIYPGMKSYRQTSRGRPTAVDLYAGSGAVTTGLVRAGFRVVAAVDSDPVACKTYRNNHPTVRLYSTDIRTVDPNLIRRRELRGRDASILTVCAPCQPFSSQNRNKSGDERSLLILEAIRFAAVLKPRVIVFENVPGLAQKRNAWILSQLKCGLERSGYCLGDPTNVDAADYGVPQRRVRCIMIATLNRTPVPLPRPITPSGKRRTVRDAIGHLLPLASGQADPMDVLHKARVHLPIALERLAHIAPDGGSRDSLPPHLVLNCHKEHRGHPDVYGRMAWLEVAPTLTTGCTDITRGRYAHPRDDRAITLREAALLQTFPGKYKFHGNSSQIAIQIGNAVPVRLIEAFGPMMRRAAITPK